MVLRDSEPNLLFGWLTLSLGDINGDGASDIVVFRNEGSPFTTNEAFLFYGASDSLPDAVYTKFLPRAGIIGDVNGDGYPDMALDQPLPQPNYCQLFFGGPGFDDVVDFTIPNVFSTYVPAVDLDADGALDLPVSVSRNGGPVNIYRIDSLRDTITEYVIPDTARDFGRNLATGDFNGDGYSDLVVVAYANLDTSFASFYWGGPTFDTVADFIIRHTGPRFGERTVPLADFNGDGYEDIFFGGESNHPYGIYFGGPQMDDRMDVVVNIQGGSYFALDDAATGDFNHDGYADLLVGHAVDLAYEFEIYIYLGGPDVDSVMYGDIYINHEMIPGSQMYFGHKVASIGDFTGDGIDDFSVFSYVDLYGVGDCDVTIFAGYDATATDVVDGPDSELPSGYKLEQNYPNPFNPSTTIEFELPHRGHATLSVYNILGRRVATLVDRELPAGHHTITWDGRADDGNIPATGIYLYRLTANGFTQTRKMVLLK
jgi:hypothetical protein